MPDGMQAELFGRARFHPHALISANHVYAEQVTVIAIEHSLTSRSPSVRQVRVHEELEDYDGQSQLASSPTWGTRPH
eukprot:5638683-Pleurochrysis_carterae.AAC.3